MFYAQFARSQTKNMCHPALNPNLQSRRTDGSVMTRPTAKTDVHLP